MTHAVREILLKWAVALVDGASSGNPGPSGVGGVIFLPGKRRFEFSYSIGYATNNEAEYSALIVALKYILSKGIKTAKIYSDSSLVVNQLLGNFKIKQKSLLPFASKAAALIRKFDSIVLLQIPRTKNKIANKLAQSARGK